MKQLHEKNFLKQGITEEEEQYLKAKYKRKIFLPNEPKSIGEAIILLLKSKSTKYSKGGNHCEEGRMRSVIDMFKVCDTYFKNVSYSKLVDCLQDMRINHTNYGVRSSWLLGYGFCNNIRKFRFSTVIFTDNDYKKCVNKINEKYEGKDKKTQSESSITAIF